jgi:hypothetical protein
MDERNEDYRLYLEQKVSELENAIRGSQKYY